MNKKAFTLLEVMLIAVIITSFLITLPIKSNQKCDKKIDNFYRMFSADLNYSIAYSLTHFVPVQLVMTSRNYYYLSNELNVVFNRNVDGNLTTKLFQVTIEHGFVRAQVNFSLSCEGKTYNFIINNRNGVVRRV